MITITNSAKTTLINLIKQKGESAVLYLKGGGCNGFSYTFEILKEKVKPHKLDEEYILDDNHNLYLCHKSLFHLFGTRIDYLEDIMGSRFDFQNKNIESKCGCGTSFNFKE